MGLSQHPHFSVTAEKVPRGRGGFERLLRFEAEGTQVSIDIGGSSRVQVSISVANLDLEHILYDIFCFVLLYLVTCTHLSFLSIGLSNVLLFILSYLIFCLG